MIARKNADKQSSRVVGVPTVSLSKPREVIGGGRGRKDQLKCASLGY